MDSLNTKERVRSDFGGGGYGERSVLMRSPLYSDMYPQAGTKDHRDARLEKSGLVDAEPRPLWCPDP